MLICKHPFLAIKGERISIASRCIWGFISVGLSYSSFRLIPLADASTIVLSSPVYVSLVACIFLKEPCGVFQIVTIFFSIFGVVLISKPTFIFGGADTYDIARIEGVSMAFVSSLAFAFAFISMRKIKQTPTAVVIFWFSLITIVASCVVLAVVDGFSLPDDLNSYLLFLAIGLCGVFGQLLLTIALKIEDAGPVSLARTIDIVMAFIYQVNILDEQITLTSLIGALLICLCVILSALRKWYTAKPEIFEKILPCLKSSEKNLDEKNTEKIENTSSVSYINVELKAVNYTENKF